MGEQSRHHAIRALLAWHRDMGAGEAMSEIAIDWLAEGRREPGADFRLEPTPSPAPVPAAVPGHRPADAPSTGPVLPTQPRQFPTTPPDAAELAARTAARSAASLDELAETLRRFDGCALKATAKNLCFYRGAARARIMLVGEAPGRDEDLEGKPFVGRAGQLLDKMLAAIGLDESTVHITNIVYWRPPGNRTPTPQEAQVCRPFLERQIELVAPDILVLLGGAAAKHVLDVTEGIMRLRGKWRDVAIGGVTAKTMATLHPAYLLRTPAAKRQAWRDLLAIKSALTTNAA
jgi:DNA polymerase